MMSLMGWCRWLTPAAALALSMSGAGAQLKEWPDQQPAAQPQQQAWPGDNQPARSGAPQPAAVQAAPMVAPPTSMMAPSGMGPPPGAARENPCMTEFTRLRGEVEKAGRATKAISDRKGTREEFCKAITSLHAAQAKWAKYSQDSVKTCGVPAEVVGQLKAGTTNLAKMRTNACNGAAAGAPPTPSLSEALGTTQMPVSNDDVPKRRGGTLDTLTGQQIR